MGLVFARRRMLWLIGVGVAALPLLTVLLAFGGSAQPAEASNKVCEVEARGRLANGDMFNGYAVSDSDSVIRAHWVHVAHSEGAVLVVPAHSFSTMTCFINGSSLAILPGGGEFVSGLWNGRPVEVMLAVTDDSTDEYDLFVYEEGVLIYHVGSQSVVDGEIEILDLR